MSSEPVTFVPASPRLRSTSPDPEKPGPILRDPEDDYLVALAKTPRAEVRP
jgi:hypothetical protein